MNKAKLLKMYMNGAHVNEIAEQCGCSKKTVYKIAARHGLHRSSPVKEIKPKPKKKKAVVVEPSYREVPMHISSGKTDARMKELMKERKKWQREHEQPWYLK